MNNPYEKYIKWWLAELGAESEYERYMKLFPELNTRLAKYAIGVYQWNMTGEIDLSNATDVNLVHEILKAIDSSSSAFDYIDNDFNGCSTAAICGLLRIRRNLL